jgi:hypothetical protein
VFLTTYELTAEHAALKLAQHSPDALVSWKSAVRAAVGETAEQQRVKHVSMVNNRYAQESVRKWALLVVGYNNFFSLFFKNLSKHQE